MRRFLLGALALAWLQAARAQGFDLSHGGPVDVTASSGLDYDQAAMTITARGDARATRGDVTVLADRLVAHLRRKAGASDSKAGAPDSKAAGAMPGEAGGGNEIYRLEALGHVRVVTPTDSLQGASHGVYDMDQAVLVMTGPHMVLTTPQQTLTARDSMEYWSRRHMAVGRGDAVVTTRDGRRINADVLVAYTKPDASEGAKPGSAKTASKPASPGAGKLERVEAYGGVTIRTQTETISGDRGVYVPDTGLARLLGHVKVTRSQNQLDGQEAVVDVHSGHATLKQDGQGQVQGLLQPDAGNAGHGGKR